MLPLQQRAQCAPSSHPARSSRPQNDAFKNEYNKDMLRLKKQVGAHAGLREDTACVPPVPDQCCVTPGHAACGQRQPPTRLPALLCTPQLDYWKEQAGLPAEARDAVDMSHIEDCRPLLDHHNRDFHTMQLHAAAQ